MKRGVFLLPVLGFGLLAFFLFKSLWSAPPQILPSAFIDKPAPALKLIALSGGLGFGDADLRAGHVSVVNFFASWCVPCHQENDTLMALAKSKGFVLYGVAYKDKPQDTRAFLDQEGNPFAAIVSDTDGMVGIDWGVTAAPETFVIDGHGVIRFKHVGPLDADIVTRELMPAIRAAQ